MPGVLLVGGVPPSPRGSSFPGVVSQHALRQTPPPLLTESQTPVKTLPLPNFVADGNKSLKPWQALSRQFPWFLCWSVVFGRRQPGRPWVGRSPRTVGALRSVWRNPSTASCPPGNHRSPGPRNLVYKTPSQVCMCVSFYMHFICENPPLSYKKLDTVSNQISRRQSPGKFYAKKNVSMCPSLSVCLNLN